MCIQSKFFDWVNFPKQTITKSENSILDVINVQKIVKKVKVNIYFINEKIKLICFVERLKEVQIDFDRHFSNND